LRAPLRGIDGFSQALLEDYAEKLDEQGKGYLNRVRKGTQKMALLIDEMLNLSRLGRMTLKPVEVDLSAIAQSICTELHETDPQRKSEFVIAADLKSSADPTLIRAVLQNLLENAWKFTSKKAKSKIEFGELDIDGEITYFVKDNGAGFNMKYEKKLFTPFQRLHQESEFPGTGIGLTTVQRIIHRHNGVLWAESKINAGATFYFTLHT
jgi:light-regulated signal transduction histidine kinase (bacteriophytochrome)